MTAALSMCKYYTFRPPAGHLVTPAQADVERTGERLFEITRDPAITGGSSVTGDRVWHPRARPRPAEALWAILAGRSRAAGPSRCPPAPAPALRRPRPGLPHRPPPAGAGSVVNRCGGGWSAPWQTRRPPPREPGPDAAQVIGRRGRRPRTAAVNRCAGRPWREDVWLGRGSADGSSRRWTPSGDLTPAPRPPPVPHQVRRPDRGQHRFQDGAHPALDRLTRRGVLAASACPQMHEPDRRAPTLNIRSVRGKVGASPPLASQRAYPRPQTP